MNKTYGLIGVGIAVLILVTTGAYFIGKSSNKPVVSKSLSDTPTPTILEPTISPTSEAPVTTKKVTAGMKTAFSTQYSIMIPTSWKDTDLADSPTSDKLTITKSDYSITISQAAGGAGSCIFPGETPVPMAQVFSSFIAITGTSSQFRRGTTDNLVFTVCEQKDGSFSFPTTFGYITYTIPASGDKTTLAEMDTMIASLTPISTGSLPSASPVPPTPTIKVAISPTPSNTPIPTPIPTKTKVSISIKPVYHSQ